MLRATCSFLALAVCLVAGPLPTPEQFAGFRIGSDKKLVRWDRIVEYMKMADAASDRVVVEELGKTTNGHPYINVIVTAPGTDLAKVRAMQRRMAYPRDLAPAEFENIAAGHKAVLLITCNIHSTEIGASQMVLELVHRLATEDSAYVRNILDNVILLLVPSANPDGQVLVVDHYNKNVGTPFEYSPLPELYHKYTGHDNNRDAFMNTQVESRILNKLMYKDWFPQVYLDEHQMGNTGPRIFVPPFKNPINPNVDASIWQLNGLLGYAMGTALHEKGYTGIINDVMYTSWWQGGFVMQAWWHNMVGLLTEVASVAVATPVEQTMARPGVQGPEEPARPGAFDPRRPLPAPRDTTSRNTYPRPWLGGKWTLRDIVDYELVATWGLLEAAAAHRPLIVRTFYNLNRKGIEQGKTEAPYAWVIPAEQHDRPAAARLAQILDELGVEVHRAAAEFTANEKKYGAGSYVVLMSQPFRAFAKDMLERQKYPEQRPAPGLPPERPYDVTGWTLPLQMGVEAVEVAKPFEAKLELLKTVAVPAGRFEGSEQSSTFEISGKTNESRKAVNRLLQSGGTVAWEEDGDFVASGVKASEMRDWASKLGIDVRAVEKAGAGRKLRRARVGLYRSPVPSMDEGWTRWLFEHYEFPYASVGNEEIRKGGLSARYDVIVFPDQSKDSILKGVENAWYRPEMRGGIGGEGLNALREFVRSGGTVVTLGSSSLLPVEEFPLPLKSALKGLTPAQFSCPGSILKVFVDTTSPIAYGMREQASAVFYSDVAFDVAPAVGDAEVRVVARYPASGMLESGWIGGEQYLQDKIAAADVRYGKGRVVVLGFSVQNRAQPHGTFKLLFNAIHVGGLGD